MSDFDYEDDFENISHSDWTFEHGFESGRPKEDARWHLSYIKQWEDLYFFDRLSSILETGKSLSIKNSELGDIIVDKGLSGKKRLWTFTYH